MAEYIDREAAIEAFREKLCAVYNDRNECLKREYATGFTGVRNVLLGLPAADVREVKRGKWISENDGETIVRMKYGEPQESCKCSVCGVWLVASDEYAVMGNFCPNCGAWMEES